MEQARDFDDRQKREALFKVQAGPQTALVSCPIAEVFFGGARGGGKTFGVLLDWVVHSGRHGGNSKGILFRRTYKELEEVMDAAQKICVPLGGEWRSGGPHMIMPNGAVLKFRHLNRDTDADLYQGHQYSWMAFDEVTNWPSAGPINKLRACLRSAYVPANGLRFLLTGNPGGVGHNWVKRRYVDPARPYEVVAEFDEDMNDYRRRVFIPSLFKDNPALALNDPMYLSRLKESGPEWLTRAWIEGDWNIVAGGMFDDVLDMRTPHEYAGRVWGYGSKCSPFRIPASWRVDRAFDWGSSAPFSVGWYAESDGSVAYDRDGNPFLTVPRGTIFRIAEWYGYTGEPNVGLRMLAKDISKGILEIEASIKENYLSGQPIKAGPADASIYNAEDGVSIADTMSNAGVKWQPCDKRPGSRKTGWENMRKMMTAAGKAIIDEPAFVVFDTCREFWRTIPVAPRNPKDLDDLDTNTEDHLADEVRYRLMNLVREIKVQKLKGL